MLLRHYLEQGTSKNALALRLGVSRDTIVEARIAAYPQLSAVRLLEEIRAAGYTGGYTQLKACVRDIRPVTVPSPIIRFEVAMCYELDRVTGEIDVFEVIAGNANCRRTTRRG